MANLMSFVLETLKGPLNDPSNTRFWLPKQLADMKDSNGNAVLPITSGSADIGAIDGSAGNYIGTQFAQNWEAAEGTGSAVQNPDDPFPKLDLSDLSVNGLDNATVVSFAATPTSTGYLVDLVVSFGQYTASAQDTAMSPLTLTTDYKISQSLQTTKDKKTSIIDLVGTGSMTATINPAYMQATVAVTVSGSGASRAIAFDIQSIVLRGAEPGSTAGLNVSNLTIDQKNFANMAPLIQIGLNQEEGQASLLQAVGTMLNGAQNRSAVSGVLTKNSDSVLTQIFGDMPAGGLPTDDSGQTAATPIDLMLFDRMRVALSDPNSNWYLPWQLAGSSNPVMEPYTEASVSVPDQTIKGNDFTDISLTNLTATGLSNIAAPLANVVLTSPHIAVELLFSTLPQGADRSVSRSGGKVTIPVPPAPPLTLQSGFSITQVGFAGKVILKGDLTLTVTGLKADATITPSGTQASDLVMTITDVTVVNTDAVFKTDIKLNPPDATLQGFINDLFQSGTTKDFLGKFLKQKIETEQAALSTEFTKIARAAIKAQLNE